MLQIVIGRNKRNMLAQEALIQAIKVANLEGTLYLGYPIIATADQMVTIDALLTTREHGVVAIDFLSPDANAGFDEVRDRQDDAHNAVFRKLLDYKPLVSKRTLSVPVEVLSFGPEEVGRENEEVICAGPDTVLERLEKFPSITAEQLKLVNAAIQRVTTIKPPTKRTNVERANSRGAIIQKIEREIANLDQWQKSAAIECPDGPQRIRGLAGSGKTIVLALKAAYLHAANPEWDIALTFHSRALYQQFRDLVRRFCFEHKNDEPDWSKLRILHSWGSIRYPGIYSEVAAKNDLPVRDFSYARTIYSADQAFGGVCDELLSAIKSLRQPASLFDAILIDEAQDLPKSFFEICYHSARDPKRVVWAYDELQNLGSYSMAPPSELFGKNGEPHVPNLDEVEGTPKRDIVLPVCYRNTPWALTTAHAIGFGIYRPKGLVQFFDDPALWQEIGYRVENGALTPGGNVTLRRRENSYPSYFTDLLQPEDSVSWHSFTERHEQFEWVADQIHRNLTEDELKHTDILIIIPDAIQAKSVAGYLTTALDKYAIQAHLAGVTSSLDRLYQDDSIAMTSIYRAKGNEAAMVYVVNSEYAAEPFRSVRGRNVLFTAITRSRAWVRICGCGPGMKEITDELQSVRRNEYRLRFQVPTAEVLANIRKIHRDMSAAEIAKRDTALKNVEPLLAMLESGELPTEALPDDFKKRLEMLLGRHNDVD